MVKPKSKVRKVDVHHKSDRTAFQTDNAKPSGNGKEDAISNVTSSVATHKFTSDTGSAWLVAEIRNMMFAFGDCPWPLNESVELVEAILRQQMSLLVTQAAEVALTRSSRSIGLEELLFIMRRHKPGLIRLVTYLSRKDFIAMEVRAGVPSSAIDGGGGGGGGGGATAAAGDSGKPEVTLKRRSMCLDFLSSIDQTGELVACLDHDEPLDEVKRERLLRADSQSRQLNVPLFFEFSKARRASFCAGKNRAKRFRDWLCEGLPADTHPDMKPNVVAMEAFNYLAQETVAQIVDLALLVKKDSTSSDPALRGIDYERVFERDCDLSWSSLRNAPSDPSKICTTSPPCSPTAFVKPKRFLKRPNGPCANIEMANAIQPTEIAEALRRYYQQCGPMTPFTKPLNSQYGRKLLFC